MMTESAWFSADSLWRAIQRGTSPANRPRTTSPMTICAIRINRTGRLGGVGFDSGRFVFMALRFDGFVVAFDAGTLAVPVHEAENNRNKKQRGDGGEHQAADDGA